MFKLLVGAESTNSKVVKKRKDKTQDKTLMASQMSRL